MSFSSRYYIIMMTHQDIQYHIARYLPIPSSLGNHDIKRSSMTTVQKYNMDNEQIKHTQKSIQLQTPMSQTQDTKHLRQ